MRRCLLFLFLSLLITSAAVLSTLDSIAPLPLQRPALENGAVAFYRSG